MFPVSDTERRAKGNLAKRNAGIEWIDTGLKRPVPTDNSKFTMTTDRPPRTSVSLSCI